MKYELLAIDLDDTVLDKDANIPKNVLNSLKKATEAGIKVCIATGRAYGGFTRYYEEMQLDTPSICVAGAQILDKDANVIYSTGIDSDTTRTVLRFAKELGIHAHIYGANGFYYEKESLYAQQYTELAGLQGLLTPEIMDWDDLSSPKILISDEPETVTRVRPLFVSRFPELEFFVSRPMFLEVANPSVNKGSALKILAEHLGIKRENVAAIGDSEIDYSMIEFAGLGGAMSNGIDRVKAIADCIVPDNNNDGVGYFIDNYVLGD